MRKVIPAILLLMFSLTATAECPAVLKFVKRKLNSQETVNMCDAYQGKTLLIVNTASYCGFTPQFKGLEALYAKYKDKGLVVLGFPSHDFNQEFDSEKKTAEFCKLTYGVKFPMFEPVHVKGDDVDLMYRILEKKSGQVPDWNFHKYLVDKHGDIVGVYSRHTKPLDKDFVTTLEKTLAMK